MAADACPQCGARVAPTDTQCLDCGADLLATRRKLREELQEQSLAGRTGAADGPRVAVGSLAGAGRALPGESSKETRLRTFDRHSAEMLRREAQASLVLALPALAVGLGLLVFGLLKMKGLGFGEVFSLRPAVLRTFAGLGDPRLVALLLATFGLGAVLVGAGLLVRVFAARQAIRDVAAGEKPALVGFNVPMQIGLLLLAVSCPPLGLLLGILLRFSSDSDIAGCASLMIWISSAVILLIAANMLIGVIGQFAARHGSTAGAANTLPAAGDGA